MLNHRACLDRIVDTNQKVEWVLSESGQGPHPILPSIRCKIDKKRLEKTRALKRRIPWGQQLGRKLRLISPIGCISNKSVRAFPYSTSFFLLPMHRVFSFHCFDILCHSVSRSWMLLKAQPAISSSFELSVFAHGVCFYLTWFPSFFFAIHKR